MSAAAAMLLLTGGAAVAYGLVSQEADPPPPPAPAAWAAESPVRTPSPLPSAVGPAPSPEALIVPPEPVAAIPARPPGAAEAPSATSRGTVRIPAIEVESDLGAVGLNPDGTMEVPQPGPDYDRAAWYDGSPYPGGTGPAVIIGHVDGSDGPSVFYRLGELLPGDTVEVTGTDGVTVTFEVDSVRSFPKDEFPTELVYGNTVGPELRLITCGGEFDRSVGSHVDNTVVFAYQV